MALPTDQTSALIVTEALKQAGYTNPDAGMIVRAQDEWLRRILQRISKRTELAVFEETKIAVLNSYQPRYALPDDCDRINEVSVYSAVHTGSLQDATGSTVTLAADEDVLEEFIKGKLIFITSGTGIGEVARVTGYNPTTKLADVTPGFDTTPAALDGYMIADTQIKVPLVAMGALSDIVGLGLPRYYHVYGKTPFKEIHFDRAIKDDTVATIKIRYNVYAHKIDLTDTRLTAIYNELHFELTQGVLAEALQDKDDSRYIAAFQVFEKYLEDYVRMNNREKVKRMKMFQA